VQPVKKRLSLCLLPLLSCVLLSGCKAPLYDKLDERQANEILAALLDHSVNASKTAGEEGTWKVMVEESQFAFSVRVLESRGLPKTKFETFGDIFKKSGILSSPMEERARYVFALSQELSRTLCEIDGVLIARVHIVLPQESELGEALIPASVSVFVKYSESSSFDIPARTADVRKLVESSTQGLTPDRIQVVMSPSAAFVEPPTSVADACVEVLGIRTARESVRALVVVLCCFAVCLLLLAGESGWLLYRKLAVAKPH